MFTLSMAMCILINILSQTGKQQDTDHLKQSSKVPLLHFMVLINKITYVTVVCLFVSIVIASVSYTLARFRDELL